MLRWRASTSIFIPRQAAQQTAEPCGTGSDFEMDEWEFRGEATGGTRFRLFPQPSFLAGREQPEIVQVSRLPGTIGPGPADDRMVVIDPIGKLYPYGIHRERGANLVLDLPPWRGPVGPPPEPDAAGHFDHLAVGTRAFELAHMYGTVRFVLDVWESYFGRTIPWHFGPAHARLEINPLDGWDNAHAGWGFLETGAGVSAGGELQPFSLNFDILAHELGHLIIYSEVGVPTVATTVGEYFGFHEAAADLIALIAVLHFESVVDRLLSSTRGNLYVLNELNRFAELSDNKQIRVASNASRLENFAAGWTDEHALSEPLSGALFDILVDIFHEALLERRLISPDVEELADQVQRQPDLEPVIQGLFDEAYRRSPAGFRLALLDARDLMGATLAETLQRLSPHSLNYDDFGAALLDADQDITGGRFQRVISTNLLWRGIGRVRVGPRLTPPDETSHAFSSRTVVPAAPERPQRRAPYRRRWAMATARSSQPRPFGG
jgi:hypothetical protein